MRSEIGATAPNGIELSASPKGLPVGRLAITWVRIPFVNTSPLTDLHLLLGLAPVFWFVGIEQFVALPLLAWSMIKLALRGKRWQVGVPAVLLAVMLVIMLLSATSIDSGMRTLTFVRTTAMYVVGLLVAIVIAAECNSPAIVRKLLRTLVLMMGVVGVMSLLGIIGVADVRFRSLAGYLLPQALADTGYGNQIVWRFLGNQSWFQGFGSYFRVSGIFLFSTMCAAATAITMPIAVYFAVSSRGFRRLGYVLVALLVLVPLVFSTGRTSWLAISAAGLVVVVLRLRLLPRILSLVLALAAVASLFLVLPPGFIGEVVDDTLYARGAGSTTSRMTIYRATLEGVMERPILGWGTERDITTLDNFDLPAGSHSHYLGFLYKHGVLGLAALLTFIGVITWQVWSTLTRKWSGRLARIASMLSFVSWALLTAALIGLTSVLDLDATLALIVWVVIFSGLRLTMFLRNTEPRDASQSQGAAA